MVDRRQVRATANIAQIRQVQQLAAQMDVERMTKQAQRLSDRREVRLVAQYEKERGWNTALENKVFDPQLVAAWSVALNQGQEDLGKLDDEIARATQARALAAQNWNASLARFAVAKNLATKTLRRANRHDEEARLGALADQTAQRRVIA